jgi:chromosome partitioning protein
MEILTIASQKGGAGKTTLSAHLAVEAERQGRGPVAVIDTDPQGSLADWWNQRAVETPIFATVEVVRLPTQIAELRQQGVTLVVIDTPPAFLPIICATIQVADLVLIPARPSPHDLRAVGVVVEMAEQLKTPFCFVVNGVTPRTTIALEAVQALAQHGPVAPVIAHQRIDFAGSMVDGRTVGEVHAASRSVDEIAQLWKYIVRKYVSMEGVDEMARKTAPLDGGLIARKGEASPATVGVTRQDPIAVTVKLDPALYWDLKHLGMQTKPRKTNQDMIVAAVKAYVQQARQAGDIS